MKNEKKQLNPSKLMKRFSLLLIIYFVSFFSNPDMCAQTSGGDKDLRQENITSIEGVVKDETGNPLAGALVKTRNEQESTITDLEGKFRIKASLNSILTVSLLGYIAKDQPILSIDKNTIVLYNDVQTENIDVVHLLYGTQNKDLTTGAYSQISGSQIETRAVVNNTNKMTGLMTGLFAMQRNGEPGDEDANLFVRGKRTLRSKDPIILVDGYERPMSFLDPNEIQSITVLKDAATASRYGLRGGNGIIQVTTNRGVQGKSRVKFHARAGLKKPTTTPKLLDSYNYAMLYNEARINDGMEPLYSSNHLDKYMNARNGVYENPDDKYLFPNINWYEDYMKESTWQQRYSVSLDGGSEYAKYFVSLGYTHNDGMYNVDKKANLYNTNCI